jgi:hypothetical protein
MVLIHDSTQRDVKILPQGVDYSRFFMETMAVTLEE